MTTTAYGRIRSVASVTVLPVVLLLTLFALGRGLDSIIADGKAAESRAVKARHISASPASFGTERALADRALDGDID